MKSIKPGRRRSRYNAVGAVIGIVFGIIWTIAALSMGAPFFFPLFGFLCGMGVLGGVFPQAVLFVLNRLDWCGKGNWFFRFLLHLLCCLYDLL